MAQEAIDRLIGEGRLWRGISSAQSEGHFEPTGWPLLDRCIGGGWPKRAVCELLGHRHQGLPLLLPLLARLGRGGHWLAWVGPPWLPFAPALAAAGVELERILLVQEEDPSQCLWATEQLLRSPACAVVLAWPERIGAGGIRRLQLAAEQGGGIGMLFRPLRSAARSSYAALRLKVTPTPIGLDVAVLKCRGARPGQQCSLAL